MNLRQNELIKINKNSLLPVVLTNEMKSSTVDEKIREFTRIIKRELNKNNTKIEIYVVKGPSD